VPILRVTDRQMYLLKETLFGEIETLTHCSAVIRNNGHRVITKNAMTELSAELQELLEVVNKRIERTRVARNDKR